MPVLLAPQLFEAASALSDMEKAQVIEFIRRFQQDPRHPSLQVHQIQRAGKDIWSAYVNKDLRAICHLDGDTWTIAHVDHHDKAYLWAERRQIGRHPITGGLQIVEEAQITRTVEKVITVPVAAPLFANSADTYLLSLGVPPTWLTVIREIRSDDQLLDVIAKLPPEVSERLMSLASGDLPTPPVPLPPGRPIQEAPDTQERFYTVGDEAELKAALSAPMERWITFLHPSQRALVTRIYKGPAKISGAAGTGKTVVGLHRARHLAKNGNQVLFSSYVGTLCENLAHQLDRLCSPAERAQIQVRTLHAQAKELVHRVEPNAQVANGDQVDALLEQYRRRHAAGFEPGMVRAEWDQVIRPQALQTWDDYRRAKRAGRGKGISVQDRKTLWQVFSAVISALQQQNRYDWPGLVLRAEALLGSGQVESPFDAVIVDEAQDLGPLELRLVARLAQKAPHQLLLLGDSGQRIYTPGQSLSGLGIDIRGRSTVLKINYRTTEQIRRLADQLRRASTDPDEPEVAARSLLKGPAPRLKGFVQQSDELTFIVQATKDWLQNRAPEAVAVFARTNDLLDLLGSQLTAAAVPFCRLSEDKPGPGVRLGTLHRAKGLEFQAVVVAFAGDRQLPQPAAIAGPDPADIDAGLDQERQLLYVAMTRARDELLITWHGKVSRFLAPLEQT